MNNIPLIIPNFNQFTYLLNLINWWRWYYPANPVYILDNGSTYPTIDSFYNQLQQLTGAQPIMFSNNDCVGNLRSFLQSEQMKEVEYYVISDPDIMPHPATPPNFLEIFKSCIDDFGFHHVGFGLITKDVPDWMDGRASMLHDEDMIIKKGSTIIPYEGKEYHGYEAPIDTTFALYSKANGGWHNPQGPESWDNSLRLFSAFHLPWYLHPDHLNSEMKYYFETAQYRQPGITSTGKNNYRPKQYIK